MPEVGGKVVFRLTKEHNKTARSGRQGLVPGGQRGPPGHQAAVRQLRPHRRGQLGHRLCAGKQGQDTVLAVLCHASERLSRGVRQSGAASWLDTGQHQGQNLS